jgi:hypothetical protein
VDLRRTYAVRRREIKRVQRLDLRETGVAQSLSHHRLMPRALLGAEHLVEVVLVRPVGITRLTGQPFKDTRDARQLQCARLREDEIAGDDTRGHADTPVSQPS